MSISTRATISWTDGGFSISSTFTDTTDSKTGVDVDVAANQTDFPIDFACDNSSIVTLVMLSTGGDLTIETNSGSAAAATVNLKNGVPLIWHNTGGYSSLANSPFGVTDVTILYATNTTATNFKLAVSTST